MSVSTGATPRPWRASLGVIVADIPNGDSTTTAVAYVGEEFRHNAGLCYGDERDANAALIVRAVNSHEALVEALKPFAHFAEVYLKNTPQLTPTTGSVYSIERMHGSASIDVEHLKAALAALLATGEK